MKRDIRIALVVSIAAFMMLQPLAEITCYASNQKYIIYEQDKGSSMTVQELLNKYEIYNIDVANVRKKYELNDTKFKIYEKKEDTLASGVSLIKQEIDNLSSQKTLLLQSLEQLKKSYEEGNSTVPVDTEQQDKLLTDITKTEQQISQIKDNIASYQQSLTTSTVTLSNSSLETKLQKYYVDNKYILERGEINVLKYKFLTYVLSEIMMKEQEKYYTCYTKNLEDKEKVEKVKQKYGLSIPIVLNSLQLEIKKNNRLCKELAYSQKQIKDYVEAETYQNNISLILEYSTEAKNYNRSSLIVRFIDADSILIELSNATKAYRDYENEFNLDSLTQQQVNQTIQSYELQYTIQRKNIEKYVSDAFEDYITIVAQLEETESEIAYANQQYTITNEKYKKGRATLLEVENKELLVKKAECEYYEYILKKVKLEFIFDNYVYGGDYA